MTDYYVFIVLPVMIFFARIADVSLGTVRIILVAKGYKIWAPILGFFEVLIWILAMGQIISHLDNWICYIAYAGGFAAGNFIGMKIEERLALGYELIRIITKRDAQDLVSGLKDKGFGVTFIEAEGTKGPVGVIYIIVTRKRMNKAVEIINNYNPNALYTIEDVRFVNREVFFAPTPVKIKRNFLRK